MISGKLYRVFFVLLLGAVVHPAFASEMIGRSSFLYVSLDSLQTIKIYKIDPASGDLTFVNAIQVSGQPGSLTVDPTHRYLHAAIRTQNSVASFRVDANTGDLSLINTVNVGWNPVYVGIDRTGAFLFTVHFGDHKAAVYSIGSNGAAQSGALQIVTTGNNPHSIHMDRSNRFLYVPCRTAESLQQYRFNESTGTLTANSPDHITTPDTTGPRHMAFHPVLNMAYVANEYGRSVTAYRIDTANGTLASEQTLSMQPDNPGGIVIAANTGGADVHLTPDGRFLYATNRGPDSIAAYVLDQTTGFLTSIGQYPTETMPRSFDIDPSGRFLFVGGQRSGAIASYGIDSSNGKLTALRTYNVGSNPVWVLIVPTDAQSPQDVGEHDDIDRAKLSLCQNSPNPFNPETVVRYRIAGVGSQNSQVSLKVYDSLGRGVAVLVNEDKTPGTYSVTWNAAGMPSGIYLYRLRVGEDVVTRKMALVR